MKIKLIIINNENKINNNNENKTNGMILYLNMDPYDLYD